MAVDVFRGFTNPVTGETFRCLSSTPEAYTTLWQVEPGGYVPFEHVHPAQEEVFHVQQGRMRIILDGKEEIAEAGQSITAGRGVRQIAHNDFDEVLRCTLEYRPALDSFSVFQCFGGLTLDGDMNRHGLVNPAKMLFFLGAMKARAITRPTYLPTPAFLAMVKVFYAVGSIAGWQAAYRRYTS